MVSIPRPVTLLFVLSVSLLMGCGANKQLVSVLVEDAKGNTELIYEKHQVPENLVKEIRYYPNGDTLSITPMKGGAVDGVVKRFHQGNQLKELVTFVDGKQNGTYRRYDNDGVLVFEGQLTDGRKTGRWTTWYDEVQMEEQRTYLNDQPDGKWSYWYIDGSLKREEIYQDGKLIDAKDF